MNSVRLTQEMRRMIVDVLAANATNDAYEALRAKEDELAEKVISKLLGAKRKAYHSLPEDWQNQVGAISVSVGGERHFLQFRSRTLGCPRKFTKCYDLPSVHPDSPLGEAIVAHAAADAENDAKRKQIRAEIRGVLQSVTTTKRLIEVWPEVAPTIEELGFAKPASKALVDVKGLNKKLGFAA